MRVRQVAAGAMFGAFIGSSCAPPENEIPTQALEAVIVLDTVRLSVSLNELAPAARLESDLVVGGLTFPTDVADFPDGAFAVLDRLDGTVSVFDATGRVRHVFGGRGLGPGEYTEPYMIARSADVLAVWDKSGRLTTLRTDGSVIRTSNAVVGDLPAAWQRVPTTNWDEPLQLSREDVTRRISGLGGGDFGLLVQEHDERFDTEYTEADLRHRFTHFAVRVDSLARVRDTLFELEGQELRLAVAPTEMTYALSWERPFPLRPLWTAGDGWHGWGHGSESRFTVAHESGDSLVIEWPHDPRPLGDAEYHTYIDWQIESHRRTKGEPEMLPSADDRRRWIEEELDVAEERPQLFGALGAGRCLALAGFRPDLGPHGESPFWLLIDLDDPARAAAVSIPATPGFTRALTPSGFFFIEIGEHGERALHRLPLPSDGPCRPETTS